jgi:tRNA(Ile)-lysidine synthase
LLVAACRQAGASHLLTAHQRDDLAEGFLLRLRRAAGVFGLAAMRSALPLDGLTLARPFLSVPRARLHVTALAAGLQPFDDPMNADPRFERARARKLLPALAEAGLDADTLAAAAERLRGAADAIEQAASAFLASAVVVDACAIAWLGVADFAAQPQAVRLRALVRLLMAAGGEDYPPRRDRLIALHDAIAASPLRLKRTLGGAVAEIRGGQVAFYREVGRDGLPSLRLSPGGSGVWDRRFSYTVAPGAPGGLVLAPCRPSRAATLPLAAHGHVPSPALAALPAVFRRGKLLAASEIPERFPSDSAGYVTLRCIVRERLDRPPLFPDLDRR